MSVWPAGLGQSGSRVLVGRGMNDLSVGAWVLCSQVGAHYFQGLYLDSQPLDSGVKGTSKGRGTLVTLPLCAS